MVFFIGHYEGLVRSLEVDARIPRADYQRNRFTNRLVFLLLGIISFRNKLVFLKNGYKATATVVDLYKYESEGEVYAPVFSFRTEDNQFYSSQISFSVILSLLFIFFILMNSESGWKNIFEIIQRSK